MDLEEAIKETYKYLINDQIPHLTNIYNEVMIEILYRNSEIVSSYYLNIGLYEDAKRVLAGEIYTEDLETTGISEFEVKMSIETLMDYLDEMNYMYEYNGKIYNPCQLTLF